VARDGAMPPRLLSDVAATLLSSGTPNHCPVPVCYLHFIDRFDPKRTLSYPTKTPI
jgi:hypothetical protein